MSAIDLRSNVREGLGFYEHVANFEATLITKALERTNGNRSAAASLLRMERTTLVEKMKKLGLRDRFPLRN